MCQPQDNDDDKEASSEPAFPLLVRDKNGRTLDDDKPQQKKPASREEEYNILPEIAQWNPNFHDDAACNEVESNTISKPRDAFTSDSAQFPISLT